MANDGSAIIGGTQFASIRRWIQAESTEQKRQEQGFLALENAAWQSHVFKPCSMSIAVLDHPHVRPRSSGSARSQSHKHETLENVIRRHGPMPVEVAIECMLKVVAALQPDRQQGLSYRLDASTITVDDEGIVTVANAPAHRNASGDHSATISDLGEILHYLVTGELGESRSEFMSGLDGFRRPDVSATLEAVYWRMRRGQFANLDSLAAAMNTCVAQ